MLVMLEGYSTALSDPTENQRLSQARASVVREFLIGKGIAADRLISYGLGQRRPSTHSESLLIRLISGQPANRPAAKKWDKVALVEVSGNVSISHQKQAGAAALPARARNELEAPFSIETSTQGQALMRFPDSSRLQLHPTSELHLETARYSASPRALTLRLSRGGLVIMNDPTLASGIPLEIKVGNIIVSGGALALRAETRDGQARVSVDEGMATVRTPNGLTLQLGPGQTLLVNGEQPPGIWRQLQPPQSLQVDRVSDDQFELSWSDTPNASAYRVELSDSATFSTVHVTQVSLRPKLAFPSGHSTKYWRVVALDERGLPGKISAVKAFAPSEQGPGSSTVH